MSIPRVAVDIHEPGRDEVDGFVGLHRKTWRYNGGMKKSQQEPMKVQGTGTVMKIRPAILSDREQDPCENGTDNEEGLQEQKM